MTQIASSELRRRSFEVIKLYRYISIYETKSDSDADLSKILKSNCFLMIYNMIESVTVVAFEELYQDFSRLPFDDLKLEIKVIVMKNAKKRNPKDLATMMTNISQDIVLSSFKKDEMFGGNLDARKFREVLKEYKIAMSNAYENEKMLTIKSNRNDLGHGVKSFTDCGKDYTTRDIKDHLISSIKFMRHFLKDMDAYMKGKNFKS